MLNVGKSRITEKMFRKNPKHFKNVQKFELLTHTEAEIAEILKTLYGRDLTDQINGTPVNYYGAIGFLFRAGLAKPYKKDWVCLTEKGRNFISENEDPTFDKNILIERYGYSLHC